MFMMATQRFNPISDKYTPEDAFDAFETLVFGNVTGESLLRSTGRYVTYATIFQKGLYNFISKRYPRLMGTS